MVSGDGVRIGRIAGIAVHVDWSLLVIFALMTLGLATGIFPAWHPDWSAGLVWATSLGAAVAFFASVLAHELSHALVGRMHGITVRRITLFMFGGLAHMENEPPSWRAELLMALAGPLASLVLGAGLVALASALAGPLEIDFERTSGAVRRLGPLATLLLWLGPVNVMLGLFNLVPGFPLDGGRVLRAVMWAATRNLRRATRLASQAGHLAHVHRLVPQQRGRPELPPAGRARVPGARAGRGDHADPPRPRRPADAPEHRGRRAGPADRPASVPGGGERPLRGAAGAARLYGLGRGAWERARVADVMTPAERLATVPPWEAAANVLGLLGRRDVNQVPVVESGRLLGLVRREDVLGWLSLHGSDALPASNPS